MKAYIIINRFGMLFNSIVGENKTFNIIQRYCKKDKALIDIGAWIGPITLFGDAVASHVYAVEPDPVAVNCLKANIALNNGYAEKISLFEGCISGTTGTLTIGNPETFGNSKSSLLFRNANFEHPVESLTFLDFIKRYNIDHCSMIKMDVEGAEFLILFTMIECLKQNSPSLLISFHKPMYGDRADEVLEAMFEILIRLYHYIYTADGREIKKIEAINEPFFDLFVTNFLG
jgi:FkbM family methyltransferase